MTKKKAAATPSVTLYGKMLTFSRLKLHSNDLTDIEKQLTELVSNKNSQIPVVIDSDVSQELDKLTELLWSWGLQPIGVIKGQLDEQAKAQRLAIFPADGQRVERVVPKNTLQVANNHKSKANKKVAASKSTPEDDLPASKVTSLVYEQMLRSGQSINHVGGDLILTNSVNAGAEAITDNSLHIYGRGAGRLVAGATGDKDAHIFCQRFDPSLVSVAGTFCLKDSIPKDIIDKPVQVSYEEDKGLVFKVMDD